MNGELVRDWKLILFNFSLQLKKYLNQFLLKYIFILTFQADGYNPERFNLSDSSSSESEASSHTSDFGFDPDIDLEVSFN